MDMMRISVATGVALRTVQRYYAGANANASTRDVIERACFELDIPTRSAKAG